MPPSLNSPLRAQDDRMVTVMARVPTIRKCKTGGCGMSLLLTEDRVRLGSVICSKCGTLHKIRAELKVEV